MKKFINDSFLRLYNLLSGTGIGTSRLIPESIRIRFSNHYRKLSGDNFTSKRSPIAEAFYELWCGNYGVSERLLVNVLKNNSLSERDFDIAARLLWVGVKSESFDTEEVLKSAFMDHIKQRIQLGVTTHDGSLAMVIASFGSDTFVNFGIECSDSSRAIASFADGKSKIDLSSFEQTSGTIRFALPEAWMIGDSQVIPEFLQNEFRLWASWVQISNDVTVSRHIKRFMVLRGWRGNRYKLESTNSSQSNVALFHELNDLALPKESVAYSPIPNFGLYFLHNSLPWDSQGYATRSHGLIRAINDESWNVEAVTRVGYPFDRHVNFMRFSPNEIAVIDSVTYNRLGNRDEGPHTLKAFLEEYAQKAEAFAAAKKPQIVHAASNSWNGIAASAVAKRFGIPFIYEVRGLWEITGMSREPGYEFTSRFRLSAALETLAAKRADHVFALTRALKQELISRGVDEAKISLLPNCVDSDRFVPRDRDLELQKKLEFSGKTIIGYVGSLLEYEGLGLLLTAVWELNKTRDDFKVLIVGSGSEHQALVSQAKELGIESIVCFTGRVPHEDVEKYYSLIDIAPFPRRGLPVCEMVSPLKPFEAMSMQKLCLVSSVDAMAEIIEDGVTGYVFKKDSVPDLVEKLSFLLNNPEDSKQIGKNARNWIMENRTWEHNGRKVRHVYNMLLSNRNENS